MSGLAHRVTAGEAGTGRPSYRASGAGGTVVEEAAR